MTEHNIARRELSDCLRSVTKGEIVAILATRPNHGGMVHHVGFYQGIINDNAVLSSEIVNARSGYVTTQVPLGHIQQFSVHPRIEAGSIYYDVKD